MQAPAKPAAVAPTAQPPPMAALEGHWGWANTTVVDGVSRAESETWSLSAADKLISGSYVRRVTFKSTTGIPFACSQSLEFTVETTYELSGTRDFDGADLAETEAVAAPSPCSPGNRPLTRYRVTPSGSTLVVRGDRSEQTLSARSPPAPTSSTTLAGVWKWEATTTDESGIVRAESELWTLQLAGEKITGSYERRVVSERATGGPLPCGGESLTLVDRYTVRGWLRSSGLELVEVDVAANLDPCAPDQRRHLNVAKGTLLGDHLVLEWRAARRQVLSRAQR